jgi:hypothetical protein
MKGCLEITVRNDSICKKDLLHCQEYHSLAKATRDHITITIEEYQKIPPFIVGINPLCDEHREKYQTYVPKKIDYFE